MKLKLSHFQNVSIGLLLVVSGLFAEYRYGIVNNFAKENPGIQFLSRKSAKSLVTNTDIPIERQQEVSFDTFWEVWNYLERDYIEPDSLNAEKMVNGAIGGMTSAIGDPYTIYLPPADNQRSGEDLAGSFYGVGIELGYIDGILAVVAPLKNTPAEQAGVQAGDLIIRVKDDAKGIDDDSSRWPLNEAVDAIRGPRGSQVTLTLYRDGATDPMEVALTRGEIVVQSVEVEFVEHNGKRVAHIMLSRFGERTDREWETVVTEVLKNRPNINGIVLDMRNNPGGYFDGAIKVASEFISSGLIVTQKGQFLEQDFSVRGRARFASIPVEVLVNRGSASASEIVAGALRDRLGSKLIGEQTFGKGTVQDRRELNNGGGLHVTIARWLLPKGDWIHDEGIPVDIEVANNPDSDVDEQLLRAIEEF